MITPHWTRLVRTGFPGQTADFYDTLIEAVRTPAPPGTCVTPWTAGEEQCVYIEESACLERLRDAPALKDYFGKNNDKWYARAYTLTALRFREADLRKQYNIGDEVTSEVVVTKISEDILKQIADPQFTKENFRDIIKGMNHIEGTLPVPYARGHVIREMHPTLGIFTGVEQTTEHDTPYALHAWLRENLDVQRDPISGYHELAVVRGNCWVHDDIERCLNVDASYGRSRAYPYNGFRPKFRILVLGTKTDKSIL